MTTRKAANGAPAARRPSRARAALAIAEPGVLNLDAIADEAAGHLFEFTLAGRAWHLRSMQDMDFRVAEAADSGELSAVRAAIQDGLQPKEDWDEFETKRLSLGQLTALFQSWREFSGVAEGDSGASSRNLGSAGTQSSQISSVADARSASSSRRTKGSA